MPTARADRSQAPEDGRKRPHPFLLVGLSLFAAWLVVLVVDIAREPDPGAASRGELVSEVGEYVKSGEDAELARYISGDESDEYAESLIARLRDSGRLDDVSVSGSGAHVQAWSPDVCMTWKITKEDGRLFLDPVPPAKPTTCPPA